MKAPEEIWTIDGPDFGPFVFYDKGEADRYAEDLRLGEWDFILSHYQRVASENGD